MTRSPALFRIRSACARGGLRALSRLLLTVAIADPAMQAHGGTAVGRVGGTFGTTPTGAATYAIRIPVAAGMNGLRPDIALSYSSQAGEGDAGAGWALSGFSEIARCPLSRAMDGRVQGVRFAAADRFCLDGHPLILISGTYGGAGAEYRTEVHGFERVISHGVLGTGPAWFELFSPDGLIYRYGNDTDSRMEAPGITEVRAWALNEIEDKFRQRVGFAYEENAVSGEYHPAEIRWTYGPTETFQQARYRLAMRWESRPAGEERSGFVWGSPWRSSQRLSAIDYEYDAGSGFARVHRYSLGYSVPAADGWRRSLLTRITECGPKDCLPATVFDWDERSDERGAQVFDAIPVDRTVFGDYNGDGAADAFGGNAGRWSVWQANPHMGGFLGPIPLGSAAFTDTSIGIPLDYNGDGLTDLMIGSSHTSSWSVLISPAPGGTVVTRSTGIAWSNGAEVKPMDVDADGLDDIVYLRDGMAYIRRNTGGALAAEQAAGIAPVAPPLVAFRDGRGVVESADFDGDGRRDLLVVRSQPDPTTYLWEAFLSTGSGFAHDPIATFTTSPNRWQVIVLDINGDGLSDVLRYDAGKWNSLVSRGTGSAAASGLAPMSCPAPLTMAAGNKAAPVDIDGDGRSEIVIRALTNGWHVHRARDGCFSEQDNYLDIMNPNSIDYGRVVSMDADGDGNAELMFGSIGRARWVLSRPVLPVRPDGTTPSYRGDLLRRIADGLGNTHELFYQPLSAWNGYSASGVSTPQTRLLRGGALLVLSEYRANTGAGSGQFGVSYTYTNARLDTQGRGFAGFQTIRASDSRSGLVTETVYRQDFPLAMRTERVTVLNGANKVSVYDPTWSVYTATAPDPAADTHFVHLGGDLSEAYEADADGGLLGNLVHSTSRTLAWNYSHGAIVTEQTTVSSPLQPGMTYRTTRAITMDESLRTSAGCLGLPDRVDVTREASATAPGTRTVQLDYDIANCRITTRLEGPPAAPAQQLRSSYAYDTSGRIQSIANADGAGALPQRLTRFAYDGAGFRPASESQVINGEADYVTRHGWSDAVGLEGSRTPPQGLATVWAYDDFGRVLAELRPTGATVTSYAACGPCFAPNARYAIRQTRADGYWSETQHDSFGRIVGKAFVLLDGRASRQIVEFDSLGRVSRESVPYIEGASTLYWTTYGYDVTGRPKVIDRPVSEGAPSGAQTSYVYAGLTTTMRDAERRATTYVHDAEGRVTTVQSPLGGDATYGYDAWGQLTTVLDSGGHGRQLNYDARGLIAQTADLDAGRRTFAYDAFGELTSLTDGKSPANTMTLQYDQLGRVTRRAEPEGTTTWIYGTGAGPARGRPQQVTAPTDTSATGFLETYGYDSQGSLARVTTTIDGARYQTDYAYGSEARLASMTYPETIGWRPRFVFGYRNGHLTTISQDALMLTPVYSLLATDAEGRDMTVRLGTALERRKVYDGATERLTGIRAGPAASPASLQNYVFEWDRVGNLAARRDLLPSPQTQEEFAYDELNRLVRVTLNGAPTLTMSYSPEGNILAKSDTGNYIYGSSGQLPHALSTVSGGPRGTMRFAYDANGNMTSRNGAPITWTSFNLPKQVNAGGNYARFTYGPGRGRIRQESRTGSVSRTIHYVGPHFEVEMEGAVRRYRTNVFAYGRVVYSQLETTPNGLEAYYVLHDHQGSVDRLVRAIGAGADTSALAFDAWGKRRNTNWTADGTDQRFTDSQWLERGFTGHEHLDNVRLIHMNGRLEDPVLGRMLTPDPVMGSLLDPQTLNPYSYVANDPTSRFDPSGYFLDDLWDGLKRIASDIGSFFRRLVQNWGRQIVAIVAAYYTAGAASSWASAAQLPDVAVSFGSTGLAAADGIGAVATLTATVPSGVVLGGIAGGAVAGAISSGSAKGAAVGALTGGISAGIGGYYGGDYDAGRVLAEASVGGISSELQGGEFGSGFLASGSLSSLTWASLAMRRAMIAQSRLNPENASGTSDGFRDDHFKLGGCRAPCDSSPFGDIQGRQGKLFGFSYGPGSFADHLIETYAGPHDFLNSAIFYDSFGDSVGRPAIFDVVNGANLFVATPFAAASVIPGYTYGIFGH